MDRCNASTPQFLKRTTVIELAVINALLFKDFTSLSSQLVFVLVINLTKYFEYLSVEFFILSSQLHELKKNFI